MRKLLPRGVVSLAAGSLVWTGDVRPLPTCDLYGLRVRALPVGPPRIVVTSPQLVPDGDGRLPHVYDDGSLCVSQFGDWRPGMLFVETFIPWTLEWLIYYELWRATGTWFGDGPDRLDDDSQAQILHSYAVEPRTRWRE